jgi:hypothetical protein
LEMGDIVYSKEVDARFRRLRCDGKPALVFAAHLGNWELPALIAAKYRLDATVLYRRPNIGAVSDAIISLRKGSMGNLVPTGLDAPVKLLRVLEAGGHVAMLVDQHYVNGMDVTFDRRCRPARSSLLAPSTSNSRFTARASPLCPTSSASASISAKPSSRGATMPARSTLPAPCRRSRRWSKDGYASTPSNGYGCTGAGADARRGRIICRF